MTAISLVVRHVNKAVKSSARLLPQFWMTVSDMKTEHNKPNMDHDEFWFIMKNCFGKDLSMIPVPVNLSEPNSILQRHYKEACSNNYEKMAYFPAFTVFSYATSAIRTGKFFNPLLNLPELTEDRVSSVSLCTSRPQGILQILNALEEFICAAACNLKHQDLAHL